MYRVCKLTNKWYACELPEDDKEAFEEITDYVMESTPIIVVNDLEDLGDFGIELNEIQIVERADN